MQHPPSWMLAKNTCKIVVMGKISVKFQLITCKTDIKCLENYFNVIWFFEWKWSADHNHSADRKMWFKNQKNPIISNMIVIVICKFMICTEVCKSFKKPRQVKFLHLVFVSVTYHVSFNVPHKKLLKLGLVSKGE